MALWNGLDVEDEDLVVYDGIDYDDSRYWLEHATLDRWAWRLLVAGVALLAAHLIYAAVTR